MGAVTAPPPPKLTPLQAACVHQYLMAPDDQTAAYRKACAEVGHKLPRRPKQAAYEMFSNAAVRAVIAEAQEKRAEVLDFRQAEVVAELRDQLSVTVPDIVDWGDDCGLTPAADLTPMQRRAIRKIKIRRHHWKTKDGESHSEVTAELEIHDRLRIVEAVMKHLGMLRGEGEPTVTNNYVLVLPQSPPTTVDEWSKQFSPRLK